MTTQSRGSASLAAVLERVQQSGAVDDDAARDREAYGRRMQADLDAARRRENLSRCGRLHALKPALRDALLAGSFEPRSKSQRAVRKWLAQSELLLLVLQGGPGCGKTAASDSAHAERGGYVRSAQQVARAFSSRSPGAVEEQERMLWTPLLTIDDLGTEASRDRESVTVALRELLESRGGLRTIITTNLTQQQVLADYADERIVSRLQPAIDAGAWVIDPGPDLRKAGAR